MTQAESTSGRRNRLALFFAQILGASSPPVIISLGGMVGHDLAPSPILTTLPVTGYTVGLALGTIPVSLMIGRFGRRTTYQISALFGISSGLLAAYGIWSESFLLFCVGTMLAGLYASAVQSYRFAVMDYSPSEQRASALQWVLIAGLCAAILGPQVTIMAKDAIGAVPYAGAFIAQSMLALMALPVLSTLKVSPPKHNRNVGGRPLGVVVRTTRFRVALATSVAAYSMMNFMMTAGPIEMVICGYTITEATLGIQWHILAMFGPSFITSSLIKRYGDEKVMIAGLSIMGTGAIVGMVSIGLFNFWIALILLGIGWNFAFFGATTMIASAHSPDEGPKVQGFHDFVMFGVVAIASLSSGILLSLIGWQSITVVVLAVVLLATAVILLGGRAEVPAASASRG